MKNSNQDRFPDRLKTASEAKKNRLERFQAAADDPERLAERARKVQLAAVRELKRQAQATKLLQEKETLERQLSENAKHEAEQAAIREEALNVELAETADQADVQNAAREAERKAERDRRYAARRNRKH
jgi:phosphatidylinositol kinase/protein kinase (PI-3  family)